MSMKIPMRISPRAAGAPPSMQAALKAAAGNARSAILVSDGNCLSIASNAKVRELLPSLSEPPKELSTIKGCSCKQRQTPVGQAHASYCSTLKSTIGALTDAEGAELCKALGVSQIKVIFPTGDRRTKTRVFKVA